MPNPGHGGTMVPRPTIPTLVLSVAAAPVADLGASAPGAAPALAASPGRVDGPWLCRLSRVLLAPGGIFTLRDVQGPSAVGGDV